MKWICDGFLTKLSWLASILKSSLGKRKTQHFPIRRIRILFLRIGSRRPGNPQKSDAYFAEQLHPQLYGCAEQIWGFLWLNVAGIWSHFKWLTQRRFAMKFPYWCPKSAVSFDVAMIPAISSSITSKWYYIRVMMPVNVTYHHITPKLFSRPWYGGWQRFHYCILNQVLVSVLT